MTSAPSSAEEKKEPEEKRDFRAVITAIAGMVVIVVIGVVAFLLLPDSVAEGETDNKTSAIVAIATAAFTAIGTVVSAYFGIRAAGMSRDAVDEARKDAEKSRRQSEIVKDAMAGAVDPDKAGDALKGAVDRIRELGLGQYLRKISRRLDGALMEADELELEPANERFVMRPVLERLMEREGERRR